MSEKNVYNAKESGIDSHRTLTASQNLDQLLNIKMNENQIKLLEKKQQ
ncbi:MAG: Spo0E family sporulation regulatory protein-aspartic acid phosphatase [Bacillota bacterium]